MARVKGGYTTRRRRKKILKLVGKLYKIYLNFK